VATMILACPRSIIVRLRRLAALWAAAAPALPPRLDLDLSFFQPSTASIRLRRPQANYTQARASFQENFLASVKFL
jgi:hypothetical protein